MKMNIIELHEPITKKRRRRKRKFSALDSTNCSNFDDKSFFAATKCKLFCRQYIDPYNQYYIRK